MTAFPRLVPSGEAALLVEFEPRISPSLNQRVHALATQLAAQKPRGVQEIIPAYRSLLIHYNPLETNLENVSAAVNESWPQIEHLPPPAARRVEIPVQYTGEDLEFVAAYAQLSVPEVVARHTAVEYRVYLMGFTPGFAYLGEVDARIAAPRLEKPRTRVPAGAVGIAGQQTGIYPIESPGGWRILGHTPLKMFDLNRAEPFLLAPGDGVQFVAVGDGEN